MVTKKKFRSNFPLGVCVPQRKQPIEKIHPTDEEMRMPDDSDNPPTGHDYSPEKEKILSKDKFAKAVIIMNEVDALVKRRMDIVKARGEETVHKEAIALYTAARAALLDSLLEVIK